MGSCYYCDKQFLDGDLVVPVPLVKYNQNQDSTEEYTDRRVVHIHQQCLGNPE